MSECGPTCLSMILKYYGLYNIQHTLREMSHATKEGTSLYTLSYLAEAFGFSTRGYRLKFERLSSIPLPCIAHYEGNHFVVVYKANKKTVWVANPAYGKDQLDKEEFLTKWNGVVLTLEPTGRAFQQQELKELVRGEKDRKKGVLKKYYLPLLWPFKRLILEILAFSFILQSLGLALPFFTQGIIDKVLVYQDKKLLFAILLGMIGIFLTQVVLTYVRNILLAQFKVNFELDFFSNFFNHFIHLKQGYFDSHKREDFINRFQENLRARRILSPTMLQPFIDLIFVGNFVLVLFFYNTFLASIVLGYVLLLLLGALIFTPRLRRLEDKIFYDNVATLRRFLDTLLGIQTVKLLSLEKLKLWEWKSTYTKGLNRVLAAEQSYARLQSTLRGGYFMSQITVYWLGAHMAFQGKMTIGQYVAFVSIFTLIMASLNSIFTLWSVITEISVSYSRLNDVFMTEPEEGSVLEQQSEIGEVEKIELKDLSFRYGENSEKYVLRGLDVSIHRGEQVAIVGRNGSGKTTLVKLLTKLYSDYEGKILVNGVELKQINSQALRRKVVMIPQEVYLFSGTVRDNIAYGDPGASMDEVVEAAKLADIHTHIRSLYLGYNQMLSEDMSSFSGGQKLKIAFARLFLSDPEVIILDEASSALDIETEHFILKNVRERFRGKTIISIAHRLHTVRHADRILVLDEGRLIEEGNHVTLVEQGGLYHQFIQTYLDM